MEHMSNCFVSIIWPTNEQNINSIYNIIKDNGYQILFFKRYEFFCSWEKMIRIIYQDDKVKENSLYKKIDIMNKYSNFLYIIGIEVLCPKYRFKNNNRKLSVAMEGLKKTIRDKFGGKRTSKNPIHIVDEQSHSINLYKSLIENGILK